MRLALLLLLLPDVAAAECSDFQLFIKKDSTLPLACLPSRCVDITVAPTGAPPIEATLPPAATFDLPTRKACHGTTCRPLGSRFTAELVRRSKLMSVKQHHELEITFTTDHKIGVVVGPLPHPFEIWDIARDIRLAIKPSPDHAKALISIATVVGAAVIVDWNDGLASVHDVSGQRGSTFRAGLITALDDTRAVVIGWAGSMTTIDVSTGKVARTDQIAKHRIPFETDSLRLGAQDLAVMWIDETDLVAIRIHAPRDAAPTVSPRQTITSCK